MNECIQILNIFGQGQDDSQKAIPSPSPSPSSSNQKKKHGKSYDIDPHDLL